MSRQLSTRRHVSLLIVLSMIAAACGGGDGETTTETTTSLDDDAREPSPTEEQPSEDEAEPRDEEQPSEDQEEPAEEDEELPVSDDPVTVESDDGTARLTFAPSTLPDAVAADDVTIEAVSQEETGISVEVDGEPLPPIAGYRLEPSGTEFSSPALLEVDIARDTLPVAPIFVISSDDGEIGLANPIGLGEGDDDVVTVEVEIPHFSVVTALHGPSPLGTMFLSPGQMQEFEVGTDFIVDLQASFNRDFLSHAIVTPTGILRLRVPRERLELIVGRELEVLGAIALIGGSLTGQLEIDIDADRPMSEAREDLPFTCAEEGLGEVNVETGITDLPLELVNEADEVVAIEPRNLLAIDILEIRCLLDIDDGPDPGTWEVSGQIDGPCGTYPLFIVISVGDDGAATIDQRASQGGPFFQSSAGLFGNGVLATLLLTQQLLEIWIVLFTGGNIAALYNSYGPATAYTFPDVALSPAHLAELQAAAEQGAAEGEQTATEAIGDVLGAGDETCTAAVQNVVAVKTE